MIVSLARTAVQVSQRHVLRAHRARARSPLTTLLVMALAFFAVAQPASAAYVQRYAATTRGGVTFTGNTLGLSRDTGAAGLTAPGTNDSIGAFITTNTALVVGTYPAGTTADWHLNSSAAVLTLPAGSTVLHAELIWGSTITAGGQNITTSIATAVSFKAPGATVVSVSPAPAAAQQGGGRYVNGADVTALVQAAGAGTYIVGGVPGIAGNDDTLNATGWTLAVAYADPTAAVRNLTIFVGAEIGGAAAAQVNGFCTPQTGTVNSRVLVTALEGDVNRGGDQFRFGPTATPGTANRLSGVNNPIDNFFASQMNSDTGALDTSGTFGTRNHNASGSTNIVGGRQGWDITNVSGSGLLGNNQTTAYAQGTSTGDNYTIAGIGLQIDVFAPSFPVTVKQVDHASTFVGDVLTYTITLNNTGQSTANSVVFSDPVPANTSFVAGSFKIDGVTQAAVVAPVNVPIGTIANGTQKVVTFQVLVTAVPADNLIHNAAHWTYTYTACTSVIPGSVDTNEVTTPFALANLGITKTDGSATYRPGAPISYTILASNAGPSAVTGAIVADTIPAAITGATWSVVYAGGATGPANGTGNINATVNIPVSGTATFTVTGTVSVSATGSLANTATITAPTGITDPTSGNNSATDTDTLNAQADLGITKTDGSATYTPGAAISYTIVASNAGPGAVTGATVTDTIPAAILTPTWTATYAGGATGPASGSGNISASVNVPVGGTATFTVLGTVSATATGDLVNTAAIATPTGTTDPVSGNNSATDTDTRSLQANLAITKTDGATSATPGSTVAYTIVASNAGPSTATNATVADTLPATITGATWTATYAAGATGPASGSGSINATVTIPAGGSATFTLTGTISPTATGSLTNTAIVTPPSGTTDLIPGNNSATDTDTLNPTANLGITKTDGSATYTPGAAISYTIVASNAGPSTATSAVVADTLPATITGATWTATYAGGATGPASGSGNINATVTIPSGATATFVVSGTVSASATGNLVNTATITAPTGTTDPNTANNSATDTDTPSLSADIRAVKTGTASVGFGGALAYTVVVSNNGPGDASASTFSDPLPSGVTGVTASCGTPTGGAVCGTVNVAGGTVTSTITTLPNGSSVTFTINATAPTSGTSITNSAVAQPPSGTTDPDTTNNTGTATTTLQQPQLTVTKTATPSPFIVGQPASYAITVTNSGAGPTAGAITVTDTLPTGITLDTAAGTNWSCTGTTALSCTFSGTIAAGGSTVLTLNVLVAANATTGNNSASATGGGDPTCAVATPPARCTGTVTTTVNASADIAVTKSVSNTTPNVGENVTFTVTATNNGPNNATGVAITDALPSGLVFVSATPSQGTYVSATGLWTVGSITNGNSATLQIVATVLSTGSITNTATKTAGNQFDPDTGNNSGSAMLNANPSADLQITKTVNNATPNLGTNIVYTITLTNAGPNDATGVIVDDLLPAGLTFVSATASQGTYDDATGLWTVGAVDAADTQTLAITATVTLPGNITNTATVDGDQNDPNTANNSSGVTLNGQSSDIQVIKGVDNANPVRGNTVTFTITATNNGPSAATGVAITDALPTGLLFVSATPSQGTYAVGTGIWSVGNLAATGAGATATLTIVATVDTDSGFTNIAALSALDQTDPNPANNSSSVVVTPVASANLAITKTDGSTTATPGGTVTYTIVASNAGPSTAANATVVDTLPATITGATWTATYAGGATGPASGIGSINATVTIPSGGSATFTLTGTISATATGSLANTATVTPPTGVTDPNPDNNSATDTDTLTPTANLGITKTDGSATYTPGAAISYTIVASNAGPSIATGAIVTDTIPAAITSATWTATYAGGATGPANGSGNINATVNIPVGATATFTVSGTVSASATGPLANSASIAPPAATTDPTPGNNSATDTDNAAPSANLGITKTDGSASAIPGGPISYTIVATNAGPSTATGAVVADTIPASIIGATWTATYAGGATGPANGSGNINATVNIPVGGTATFNVSGTVSAAATGTLANTATVTPPTGTTDPTPGDNTATDSDTLTPSANLAITKTDGSANYTPGASISYTIVASNAGPSIATGAIVSDTIPAAISGATWSVVYAGGATGPANGAGNISATVNIPVGATATFTVTGTVSASATGNLANTATITVPTGTTDPTPGDNSDTDTDTAAASADIASLKSGPASVGLGGALIYTVVVSNNGPSNANGATFSDPLPAGITAVTASCGTPTGGAACGAVNVAGGTVTSTITTLPSGASVTFTINGTAPLTGASISNTATANPPAGTTDPTPGNNASTVTTNLTPAQLTVTKTATPTPFVVGQPAQYTIVVQNTGSGTTNAPITVADTLPTGITLASFAGTNWTCTGTITLSCTFSGTLAPNATATLTLNVNVAASATTANNAATATGGGDPTCSVATPPARCTGTVTVPVAASADIAVTKTVDNATPNVGQNVIFTITASNNGPSNATGVAITDALPSGLAFVSATPSQGSFTLATGLWSVGALTNGNSATLQITATVLLPGALTNTATKTAGDQLDPDTSNNSAAASINGQPSADLQVFKTVDNAVPNLGTNVTFTITVTNAGPNDATGVVISDPLPLGLNFVSATPSQGTYDDATGLWTVGAVTQGTSQTLTLVATATLPGDVTNNAAVSASNQFDPNPANNSSGATINGQSADLQIVKTVNDANPVRGDTVTFTITATNNGPSNATGVAITDALPTGLVYVSSTASQGAYANGTGVWTVGSLAATGAGATATLTIVATVDTDSGFTNTAAVSAAGQPDPNPANNSSSVVVTPSANADLSITKTDGATTAIPGTAITYTIVASNAGPSTVTGATVADTLPASITGATWTAAYSAGASGPASGAGNINATVTIPANGTATFTLTGTISATATGTLANTATVTAPAGTTDPTPGNNSATDTDTLVPTANIGVVKTGPTSVVAGSAISYSVVVSNAGQSAANGTTFTDAVPASITGITATCGAPTTGTACGAVNVTGNTVTSTITTLPSGGSVTFTISGIAPADGTGLSNTASAAPPTGVTDPDPSDNSSTVSTTVGASADLSIVKTGPTTVQSGAPISYTLLIANAGPSAADGATYSDNVPAGITGVIASCGLPTGGATCANPGVTGNTVSGSVPALPSGGSVTITVSGNAPFGSQTLNNIATVTPPAGVADPTTANNTSSASTTIGGAADIALTKSVDNAAPNVGDTVVFTITARNDGPNDASGVAVTDSLPVGLGFISATPSQGTYTSGSGLWTIGALANGDTVTLTITATVDQPGSLTNTVAVSAADQPDPDTSNNNAGASVGAGATADIGIAKSVDNSAPNVGDSVTYTLTVTNHGPNDATGVEATDHLPTGTTFVAALPSQGTYDDVGGVWTIGAIANGASATLTITVDVTATGSITNTGTLTHEDQFDPVGANNQAGTTLNGQQADLGVTKTIDNAIPNVGDTVTFTVAVHNNGPSAATNVALTDQLPAGLAYVSSVASQGAYVDASGIWTVGTLSAAGPTSSATLTVVATVTQAGALVNTASVGASDQPDPNTTNNSDSASLNGNPLANLAVDKSGPASVTPGNDVVYTVVITNNGPSDATNVIVTDPTPAGLTFIGNAGACVTAYPCSIASLANGASATITTTYTMPANYTGTNPVTNTASATSDTPDPDTTDNQSSAQTGVGSGNAELSIVKSGPATVASGASVTYQLAIVNNGPSPANGATYTDNVPAGITAISATCGGVSGGASCSTQPVVTGNAVSGTIGSLPSGAGVTITITGTAGTGPLTLSNTATIDPPAGVNDPDTGNNSSTVTTAVGATSANLSVQKLGPTSVSPGANVTYTLTVTNAGPDTALDAVLDDPTPTGLTFVSASTPCAAGFPCVLGDIASGGSTIVTVTFAVPLDAAGLIANTATIGSDTPDPTPSDNISTVTTTIVPAATSANLVVVKTGPASIAAGTDITYSLAVTNNGPDAANNVVLADATPAGLTFVSATAPCAAGFPCTLGTLASGASTTVSVTFTVSAAATGTVDNTASVTSDTPDPDGTDNVSTVTSTVIPVAGASADLVVTKTGPATTAAGSTVNYLITIANNGPDDVPDAVLTDPTPAGLTYVASSAPCAGGFPCAVGAIANGTSVSVTVVYQVDAGFSGVITNIASANSATVSDPTPNNNASTVTTTVAGTPVDHTLAVPVNSRWMLMLLAALLVLLAAPKAIRRP